MNVINMKMRVNNKSVHLGAGGCGWHVGLESQQRHKMTGLLSRWVCSAVQRSLVRSVAPKYSHVFLQAVYKRMDFFVVVGQQTVGFTHTKDISKWRNVLHPHKTRLMTGLRRRKWGCIVIPLVKAAVSISLANKSVGGSTLPFVAFLTM